MSIVERNVQNKENDFVSSNQVLTVVLIVLCLVLLLSFVANKATTSPARDVEVASPPVLLPEGELLEPVPERKSITEDEIDKLYLGYTYEELEDLFGCRLQSLWFLHSACWLGLETRHDSFWVLEEQKWILMWISAPA